MNTLMENLTGMAPLTDEVIGFDFLIAAKTAVKQYSIAISEATHPEVRAILKKQMDEAVLTHETISAYMIKKGFYHPHDMKAQIREDFKLAETALKLAEI